MRFYKMNKSFFDWFALAHFMTGVLTGILLILLRFRYDFLDNFKNFILTGLIILLVWEVFEISLRYIKGGYRKLYKFLIRFLSKHIFSQESKVNIVGDIVIGMAGLLLVYLIF